MKYNTSIVLAYFKECGLPEPEVEFPFAQDIGRKWRFDFAWPDNWLPLALEVQGGCFVGGGHVRGGHLRKEHEKFNEAAARKWLVLRVFPEDLCTQDTVDLIKRCLGLA